MVIFRFVNFICEVFLAISQKLETELVSLTKISLIVAIRFSMTGCLVKQLKGLKHMQTLEYT